MYRKVIILPQKDSRWIDLDCMARENLGGAHGTTFWNGSFQLFNSLGEVVYNIVEHNYELWLFDFDVLEQEDGLKRINYHLPIHTFIYPGGAIYNVFNIWKHWSEVWSMKFHPDQMQGEVQWLRRNRWYHLLDIIVPGIQDVLGNNIICFWGKETILWGPRM